MKVKISEKSVVFKLSEVELEQLLANLFLETKVNMGHGHLYIAIDLIRYKEFTDYKERPLRLISDWPETRLVLYTMPEEILKLADMGKNREGLSLLSGGIECRVQVDIRNDSRSRKINQ